ncbi:MAG: hypothetical protein IPL83_20865 [Bdellovibrionales bacterium]|nr:hypothetical protein [Bdellovibrionales bacterium]
MKKKKSKLKRKASPKLKKQRLRKTGVVRKQAHASSSTKRKQAKRDNKE